ncbi:ribonuclease HII [Sinomicrobium sp.]
MLNKYFHSFPEAGTDEAGRGCLAGPVTAAAVILPENFDDAVLNDSKQLSKKQRGQLRLIIEEQAVSFGVCHIFEDEIYKLNILHASIQAMHRALDQLGTRPQHILVDGNRFKPYHNIPHLCVVKGDGKYLNIAAASVLAKTYRDHYMEQLHEEYPMYNWKKNKGYPTREHREAIRKYGISPYHRKGFRLLPDQLELGI